MIYHAHEKRTVLMVKNRIWINNIVEEVQLFISHVRLKEGFMILWWRWKNLVGSNWNVKIFVLWWEKKKDRERFKLRKGFVSELGSDDLVDVVVLLYAWIIGGVWKFRMKHVFLIIVKQKGEVPIIDGSLELNVGVKQVKNHVMIWDHI